MAEHKHGEMDIEVQEKTFAGFISFVTKTVIVILVAVILLAMING
ncbi:aa3-type cytochrome c oxidase subunit IV [Thalassococcus sp. BH17M4-6]